MVSHKLQCLFSTGFLLGIYFPTNYAQLDNTVEPEVTIPQGALLGTTRTTRNGRNISAFLGIPYAKPPTGDLRFANPVAADGWDGILNATVDPNKCPQLARGAIADDEDCLYARVYTPQLPRNTNAALLPVMVFIHGGAFSWEAPGYSGPEYLLDEDVVLVTANYRLGPLGFLSTGDEVASGNWGLKDQVLALKWVQDNIRYFGGDPDQVTIFGESAGAACVHLLTLSNATKGLFHRYITQSGSALGTWAHRPRAAYSSLAFKLGEYVGCSNETSVSLISCLRTVDYSRIIATKSQFVVWEFLPDVMWGPTDEPDVEGAVLTDSPANLFAAGKIRDLPWISGVVRDEGLLHSSAFYRDEAMARDFLKNIDTLLPLMLCWMYRSDSWAAQLNATKSHYFNNDLTTSTGALLKNLTALIGDSQFFYPARKALELHRASAVNPQYFYTFDYRGTFSFSRIFDGSTASRGVAHADDLIYIFPKESEFSCINKTMSETDYEMVDKVVGLWTSFAIDGIPTASVTGDAVTWEPYSTEGNYLRIGNESDSGLELRHSFFEEGMRFWDNMDAPAET